MIKFITCPKFEMITTEENCLKCKTDPLYQQSLFVLWRKARSAKQVGEFCTYRATESSGTKDVHCCGNKIRTVKVYHCSKLNAEVFEECFGCKSFESKNECGAI